MSTYVAKYTSLFSQLEQMSKYSALPKSHKAPVVLAFIDFKGPLDSTSSALRTKHTSELTWEYVATTDIDENNYKQTYMVRSGSFNDNTSKRKKKLKSNVKSIKGQKNNNCSDLEDRSSEIKVTARAFAVSLKSAKSNKGNNDALSKICKNKGHTEDRCYQNMDNPDNKFPAKLKLYAALRVRGGGSDVKKGSGREDKIKITATTVAKTTLSPLQNHFSLAYSGATAHCLHTIATFFPVD